MNNYLYRLNKLAKILMFISPQIQKLIEGKSNSIQFVVIQHFYCFFLKIILPFEASNELQYKVLFLLLVPKQMMYRNICRKDFGSRRLGEVA